MRGRRTQIDSKQAQKLDGSHIGAYLFYNEFALGGRTEILPTVKLANLVYDEAKTDKGVDAINEARDFAIAVAFDIPFRTSAIGSEYSSPEDAIEALFSVDLELQLNHLLVTSVGEHLVPVAEIVARERHWETLVHRAIFNRSEDRAPFDDGPGPAPGP